MQAHMANLPTMVPATNMEQLCTPEDSAVAPFDLVLSPAPYAEGPRSNPTRSYVRCQVKGTENSFPPADTKLAHKQVPAPHSHDPRGKPTKLSQTIDSENAL